tara:strand:+ start:1955 stop:5839 length:3885 start_codon:yes stop_codon:yes gene_type:complete
MTGRPITRDGPTASNWLCERIWSEFQAVSDSTDQTRVSVIGIDGPTAAGKTSLAKAMRAYFETEDRECWIYQMDWTLVARQERVRDLEFFQATEETFIYEGELHMRLQNAEAFLRRVTAFNQLEATSSDEIQEDIDLKNLYSRDDDGQEVGIASCRLRPGLIILVEGHYTLRTELDRFIDLNILLLSDPEELIRRKVARVKGYRSADAAVDYFHRIDVPSFTHHLARFLPNADLVIENTDYMQPFIQEPHEACNWISHGKNLYECAQILNGENELVQHSLGNSARIPKGLRESAKRAVSAMLEFDSAVGRAFRLAVKDVDMDLTSMVSKLVDAANNALEAPYEIKVGHTNALHNVYFRHLPISLGLAVHDDDQICLAVLADVLSDSLRISITWSGASHAYKVRRSIGGSIEAMDFEFLRGECKPNLSRPIDVLLPTQFMMPAFLSASNYNVLFTGREDENVSASEALARVLCNGGVWIHRFALFKELNFFLWLVERCGMSALKAGNYLIAIYDTNKGVRQAAKRFFAKWRPKIEDEHSRTHDEQLMDVFVETERSAAGEFVTRNCPDFVLRDNYLFCTTLSTVGPVSDDIVKQLQLMLKSDVRLIRKRAFQFIQLQHPNLLLKAQDLWPDLSETDQQISIETFSKISPSILGEVYLWLALREEPSAVLGATIYDVSENSVDCYAYLSEAMRRQTPVVLQASLNALGQKEDGRGQEQWGYLKPSDGPVSLANAAMRAARDLLLEKGDLPILFGVGLDHIDIRGDVPIGRARRFVEMAWSTGLITHYVLDASELFEGTNSSPGTWVERLPDVVRTAVGFLPKSISPNMDFEFCFGELNYPEKDKPPKLITTADIDRATKSAGDELRRTGHGEINVRPKLMVGDLGTTHHKVDSAKIVTGLAREWVDSTCRQNFVSAVLHGTTSTAPEVLREASDGCYKVNCAGDFLATLLDALPEALRQKVSRGAKEPKRGLYKVQHELSGLGTKDREVIIDALTQHCSHLMDTIQTPQLSKSDIQYLQYRLYSFTDNQIDCLLSSFAKANVGAVNSGPIIRTDPNMEYSFAASMIEVPFGEEYKEMVDAIWEEGIINFHIDVADGEFIPRSLSALDKVEYLRLHYPECTIHVHMMAKSPHQAPEGGQSLIESYANAGCNAIAVHEDAFQSKMEFSAAVNCIRVLDVRPGLLIETDRAVSTGLFDLIVANDLDWVVAMGVPIGFGGQVFDKTTLARILAIQQFALANSRSMLIEVDGGLTIDILPHCLRSGAQLFAGWSIVRSSSIGGLRQNLRNVKSIIEQVTAV